MFKDYLSHSSQNIMYNDLLSSKCYGICWCTPGFSFRTFIYVNDVAENMHSMCRLFADDNLFQQSSHDMFDIEYKLNHDLQMLETWSNKWLLKFNQSKTKNVFFSRQASLIFSMR